MMKKICMIAAALVVTAGLVANAALIASYDFATDLSATSESLGTASDVSAGPGIVWDSEGRNNEWTFESKNGTAYFMSEVIRSSTLSTALSDGDYVSFTFTPTASVDFQGFTFDIPAQGIAAGTSYVLFSDQKAFTSGNEIGSISTPDNGAYTDQTISLSSMSSASSATEFRLYMWSDGSFDKGVYGLDNFELTAVPEPATLGMVGFAGLAMLLLRRRMCK